MKYSSHLSVNKEIVFLLSGVLVNLVFFLLNIQKNINFCLFLINIIPIYPLDGGRILKLILNKIFCLNVADKVYIIISVVILFLLITLSILTKNLSLLLISIYVIIYSFNNSFD